MDDANVGGSTRTRQEKTKRLFLTDKGEAFPRASVHSHAGKIVFIGAEDEPLEFHYDDLSPEIRRVAALWGIMTAVTNTVGRADMDLSDMMDAAKARLEAIVDEGKWSTERQSGPRTNDLIEAARRWYKERGRAFDEDTEAKMQAALVHPETGEEYKAKLQKNVAVQFAAIKAERAAERAKKAADKAAGTAEVDDLL